MNATLERAIGRLLRPLRQRDARLAWNHPALSGAPEIIRLESPDFVEGGAMPARCAGAGVGDNRSPALHWSGVPAGTAELVLIVEDPDAPPPRPIVHLVATGIAPGVTALAAGALNGPENSVVRLGRGAFGRVGYAGPRPIRGHGPHRYVFQIVALAEPLKLDRTVTLAELLQLLPQPVLARGKLTGVYERP